LALLAIAAGVVILLKPVKPTTKLGVLLLGIWLIATGLLPLVGVRIPASDIILALLAIVAGIVILLGGKAPGGGG
jgi:hypothetical protein